MPYYITKIVVTTLLVVIISEIAKRSSFMGALLASIPLISVLALFWLYIDTQDTKQISVLATSVFWLVLPSLVLFISLPLFLKNGMNFYISMAVSIILTIISYFLMIIILKLFNINL